MRWHLKKPLASPKTSVGALASSPAVSIEVEVGVSTMMELTSVAETAMPCL